MSQPGALEATFVTRLGLAIASPRWAFAIAGDRRHPGRAGNDLIRVIAMVMLGAHLRGLVVAGWLALAVHLGLGVRTFGAVLSTALTMPLAFLVVTAGLLWAASGKARHIGRAFDLACVAVIPLMFVLLIGISATRIFELTIMPMVGVAILGIGFGWAGALVTLALATARLRVSIAAVPPADVVARGRRVGTGLLGLAALAVVLQLGWIALHLDRLRPVVEDERAPAFALPEVGADGQLLGAVGLGPAGRVQVVEFWATWCSICVRGLPHLEALRKAHPDVDVLTINLDDAAKARRMFEERGYGLRLLFDTGGVADRYNVSSLPHLVVIGRDGMVHEVKRGAPGDLEALLR